MSGPPDLSPREAVNRWLDKRRIEVRESSISSYWYRLKLFVEWCEDEEIEHIGDLTPWNIESYETDRRNQGIAANSIHNELETLKNCLEYLAGIGVVDQNVPEAIIVPDVPDDEVADDTRLAPAKAKPLIQHYEQQSEPSREGTSLVVAWYTGARIGGIRALDRQDYDRDEGVLQFRHRPETDTPLKRGLKGERDVGLPDAAKAVVDHYVDRVRDRRLDEYGREPLFVTSRGRPAASTLRLWIYQATWPCHLGHCPHGREIAGCEYRSYNRAGGCPSARSPHQIRTGAIMWMRNNQIPPHVVAERVNSSVETIKKHYDPADHRTKFERRRDFVNDLEFNEDDNDTE